MAYQDIYNLRHSSLLKAKVAVALANTARTVLTESATTANHAARLAWAKQVIKDIEGAAEQILWGVVSNSTVQSGGETTADATIQTIVDSLVDAFAV